MKRKLLVLVLLVMSVSVFAAEICTVQILFVSGKPQVTIDYGDGNIEKMVLPERKGLDLSVTDIILIMKKQGWDYVISGGVLSIASRTVLVFTKQ